MTNGSDRLAQLESLVLDFARAVNQSQSDYNQRLQQTEARLAEHIQTTNENFQTLAASHQAIQQEIAELRESHRDLGDFARSLAENIDRLSTEVIPRLADKVAETEEQVRTTSAGLEQLERTVDYLMRRDQGQNGEQPR